MKKLVIMSVMLASSFIYKAADAQVRVNLNVNLGSQPQWGPTGYDHVDYYYLPDIDVYYNVPNQNYTYQDGTRWITSRNLPQRYRNYDLYKGYKVVVNQQKPWTHAANNRASYANYKGRQNQAILRDRNNTRDNRPDKRTAYNQGKESHGRNGRDQRGGRG